MEELNEYINNIIKNSKENISVLIKELNKTDDIYKYKTNVKLISASTIKVPIMLAILEQVKENNITLDEKILVTTDDILNDTKIFENISKYYSLYDLINWMIIESDNTATNVLIKCFGMNSINQYITNTLNLNSTVLQRYMLDFNAINKGINNYTSQDDLYLTFSKLFNKEILNNDLCNIAIDILYNQQHQDQIMKYINNEVKFAHKTGSLSYLNHDCGVMNINHKLYYIGISVYDSKKKDGNKELVSNLGKTVYEYIRSCN